MVIRKKEIKLILTKDYLVDVIRAGDFFLKDFFKK